jgi:hypothetical protein
MVNQADDAIEQGRKPAPTMSAVGEADIERARADAGS